MIGIGILLGKAIALAFHRFHVEQHRPFDIFRRLESAGQVGQIVAIDRPQIVKAHILENRAVLVQGVFDFCFYIQQESVQSLPDEGNV